jgi:hypothetical protein
VVELHTSKAYLNTLHLHFSKANRGLTDFEKYLQSQEELQKRKMKKKLVKNHAVEQEMSGERTSETNQKKGQKRNSPLKKSILLPKKQPRKEKLGTHSSDDWWQVLCIFNIID